MTKRYTIDLSEEFDDYLTEESRKKHLSKAEVIRRAVASYRYLESQADEAKGLKVSITDKDDKVVKDVVLP